MKEQASQVSLRPRRQLQHDETVHPRIPIHSFRDFRMTKVRPWLIAVAATNISITGRLRLADNSPQRRAVAASIGSTRSAKVVSMPSTQAPSWSAASGSVRRLAATPLRNSPRGQHAHE